MVGWITLDKTNCKIKFTICGIMFLYSQEGWITMIGTRLQETEPTYNKR